MELHCPQCQHVLDQDNGQCVAHPRDDSNEALV